MMLAIDGLRVVPVTVHLALKDVAGTLTATAIVTCGRMTARALKADFGIARPRIAVAALNPHAGEDGIMGDEESRIIAPAVAQLAGRRHRHPAPRRRIRCSIPPRARASTRRSACTTTRR